MFQLFARRWLLVWLMSGCFAEHLVADSSPFLGEIMWVPYTTVPVNWMRCDGQVLLITSNPNLFTLIGATYGGDGITTFALPDARSRTFFHLHSGTLGEQGGLDQVTLTLATLPSHLHGFGATSQAADSNAPSGDILADTTAFENIYDVDTCNLVIMADQSISNTGGGLPHNNMSPFLTLNCLIAVQGVFPQLTGTPGTPAGGLTCPNNCNDNNDCTTDICDTNTGLCSYTPVSFGTACTGDCSGPCSETFECDGAGSCLASAVCPLSNDFCVDIFCSEQTLGCIFVNNTLSCDDGLLCTTNDMCTNGACAGTPVVCVPADICHNAGTCDPNTGICSNPTKPNGSPCGPSGQTCQNGQCVGGGCTDSSQCTSPGTCESAQGVCVSGVCLYPNAIDGTSCNDFNLCTVNDFCVGGQCVSGTPIFCNTPGVCQINPGMCIAGLCIYPSAADGTPCEDGNRCTKDDKCSDGICEPGSRNGCKKPR